MMKVGWICLALMVLAAVEGALPSSSGLDKEIPAASAAMVEPLDVLKKESPDDELTMLDKLRAASKSTEMIDIPISRPLPIIDTPRYYYVPYHGRYHAALKKTPKPGLVKQAQLSALLRFPKLLDDAMEDLENSEYQIPLLKSWYRALKKEQLTPIKDCDRLLDDANKDLQQSRINDHDKKCKAVITGLDLTLPWRYKLIELEMQHEVLLTLLKRDELKIRNTDSRADQASTGFKNEIREAERALLPKFVINPSGDENNRVDSVSVTVAVEACRVSCQEAANHLLVFAKILVEKFVQARQEAAEMRGPRALPPTNSYDQSEDPKDPEPPTKDPEPPTKDPEPPKSGGPLELESIAFTMFLATGKSDYDIATRHLSMVGEMELWKAKNTWSADVGGKFPDDAVDALTETGLHLIQLMDKVKVEIQKETAQRLQVLFEHLEKVNGKVDSQESQATDEKTDEKKEEQPMTVKQRIAKLLENQHQGIMAREYTMASSGTVNKNLKRQKKKLGKAKKLKGKKKGRRVHKR